MALIRCNTGSSAAISIDEYVLNTGATNRGYKSDGTAITGDSFTADYIKCVYGADFTYTALQAGKYLVISLQNGAPSYEIKDLSANDTIITFAANQNVVTVAHVA